MIEVKLKPFISKKIVEYLGAEEPDLRDFVSGMIAKKCSAQSLLDEMLEVR
jgi:hypothetical protein